MAVNPIYEKLTSVKRLNPQANQSVVECVLQANEEIKDVLAVRAEAFLKNCNIVKNAIEYSGVVNFSILYNDVNNLPQALNYMAEFNDKLSINNDMLPNNCICIATVVDNKIINVSANSIKVNAVIEVKNMYAQNEEINALSNVEGENVYIQTEEIQKTSLVGTIDSPINLNENFSINDSISNVLEVSVEPILKSVVGQDGFVKVSADALVNICYLTDGENATIRNYNATVNIDEEIKLDFVDDENLIEAYLTNNIEQLLVNTNIDVDKAEVEISAQLILKGFVYDKEEISVVSDLFSTENEITTCTSSFNSVCFGGNVLFEDKISCGAVITDEMPFADDVLSVCVSSQEITNSYIANNKLNVEGVVRFNVLYFNRESMSVVGFITECPFEVSGGINDDMQDFSNITSIAVGDITFKSRRGKEIDINANVFVTSNLLNNENCAVITNIEVGEEKQENECAISIYYVKAGEQIWDVAKKMNVSPDLILEQNPDLKLPLEGGEKVFIFRQKQVEI